MSGLSSKANLGVLLSGAGLSLSLVGMLVGTIVNSTNSQVKPVTLNSCYRVTSEIGVIPLVINTDTIKYDDTRVIVTQDGITTVISGNYQVEYPVMCAR